jgi:hypothetical protein
VDKFAQIAREVEGGFASVGEYKTCVLVRSTLVDVFLIPFVNLFHLFIKHIVFDIERGYEFEIILGAVPLATLCETTHTVSHKLMRTSARDALDLECEIDMLKYTVMTVAVKVLDQLHGVFRV